MNEDITEMRAEQIRLIRHSDGLIGVDRRRANRMIAELQSKIDFAKERNKT